MRETSTKIDFSFLDSASVHQVERVLCELDKNIFGHWALTGSLSYRTFLPQGEFNPGLRDIDIVIAPDHDQDPLLIVQPDIKNYFYILELTESGLGYYFRLVHKSTDMRVDIFTPLHKAQTEMMEFSGRSIDLVTPEENMLAMIRDQSRRLANGETITQKWVDTAKGLWFAIDRQKALSFIEHYRDEFNDWLPKHQQHCDVQEVVDYLLNLEPTQQRYGYAYPQHCVTTLNGISIEDEVTHRRVCNVPAEPDYLSMVYQKVTKWLRK